MPLVGHKHVREEDAKTRRSRLKDGSVVGAVVGTEEGEREALALPEIEDP